MTQRILEIGTQEHTQVVCTDEPGAGGACHKYEVVPTGGNPLQSRPYEFYARVDFQNGPIKENGINGCHNEDLIAIVIDRLQHFQAGDYSCQENAIALMKMEEAFLWLRKRTDDRNRRGVEGTSIK